MSRKNECSIMSNFALSDKNLTTFELQQQGSQCGTFLIDSLKNLEGFSIPFIVNCEVGKTYWVDGIETICVKAGRATQVGSTLESIENEHPIFVIKNHDLSYWVSGDDFIDSDNYGQAPGTYGFDFGGTGVVTNIYDDQVGKGYENTSKLINLNLTAYQQYWRTIWDALKDFRSEFSDKWFVPNSSEWNLILPFLSVMNGLSYGFGAQYWCSNEYSGDPSNQALSMNISVKQIWATNKNAVANRTRLCVML